MSEEEEKRTEAADVEALRAHNIALQQQLKETEQAAWARLVQAELKAEAVRAGMVDLDCLKLIETGSVSVDEDGSVVGATATMAKLRRDKPWLFQQPNSSSVAHAPPAAPARPRMATDMTLEEWRRARAELIRRR
jgi:hypothetical protein